MQTSVLRALIKNSVKESFYGKKKKIIFWHLFFIAYKSNVKIFLRTLVSMTLNIYVNMHMSKIGPRYDQLRSIMIQTSAQCTGFKASQFPL